MSDSQFTPPVIVSSGGKSQLLERLPISSAGASSGYDEAWLQKLVFEQPKCLPVSEIDQTFSPLVPICRELNTPAGPMDVIYATPQGKLVIVEVKLWRNPEARRTVIAQILDYAKEVSRWSYEDLQREVSRATGRKGNALFEIVAEQFPKTEESAFVDEMTRTLREGRFLLLIVGDGIREGAGSIAQFLQRSGNLHFTFGLVEMAIFKSAEDELLVQPRILSKSEIVQRSVVSLTSDQLVLDETEGEDPEVQEELNDRQKFYYGFWREFLEDLQLDDVGQPRPNPNKIGSIAFPMPTSAPSRGQVWVTVYFLQSKHQVGVFLTFLRGPVGDRTFQKLESDKEEIERELDIDVRWQSEDGKHSVWCHKEFANLLAPEYRSEIKEFLADRLNLFVNTFRPRLARIHDEE